MRVYVWSRRRNSAVLEGLIVPSGLQAQAEPLSEPQAAARRLSPLALLAAVLRDGGRTVT